MSTGDLQQKKPARPFLAVSGLLGGVLGVYCGLMILIPLAGGIVALLLLKHFAPPALKPFTSAIAVIFGHMVWMLVGVMIAHMIAPVIPDLVVIVLGLLWIVLRPGLGPVIFLGIYEIICLLVNIMRIISFDFGSVGHRALTAHIALRLFALGALIAGYREFRKSQTVQNIEIPPKAA
jgi:hypothetical protein